MVLVGMAAGKRARNRRAANCCRAWVERSTEARLCHLRQSADRASHWYDEMLGLETNDLLHSGFELSLTGISLHELSRLSAGVSELERCRNCPIATSPIPDMTFIL